MGYCFLHPLKGPIYIFALNRTGVARKRSSLIFEGHIFLYRGCPECAFLQVTGFLHSISMGDRGQLAHGISLSFVNNLAANKKKLFSTQPKCVVQSIDSFSPIRVDCIKNFNLKTFFSCFSIFLSTYYQCKHHLCSLYYYKAHPFVYFR